MYIVGTLFADEVGCGISWRVETVCLRRPPSVRTQTYTHQRHTLEEERRADDLRFMPICEVPQKIASVVFSLLFYSFVLIALLAPALYTQSVVSAMHACATYGYSYSEHRESPCSHSAFHSAQSMEVDWLGSLSHTRRNLAAVARKIWPGSFSTKNDLEAPALERLTT